MQKKNYRLLAVGLSAIFLLFINPGAALAVKLLDVTFTPTPTLTLPTGLCYYTPTGTSSIPTSDIVTPSDLGTPDLTGTLESTLTPTLTPTATYTPSPTPTFVVGSRRITCDESQPGGAICTQLDLVTVRFDWPSRNFNMSGHFKITVLTGDTVHISYLINTGEVCAVVGSGNVERQIGYNDLETKETVYVPEPPDCTNFSTGVFLRTHYYSSPVTLGSRFIEYDAVFGGDMLVELGRTGDYSIVTLNPGNIIVPGYSTPTPVPTLEPGVYPCVEEEYSDWITLPYVRSGDCYTLIPGGTWELPDWAGLPEEVTVPGFRLCVDYLMFESELFGITWSSIIVVAAFMFSLTMLYREFRS